MDEERRLLGMLSPEARALSEEIDAAGAVEAAQDGPLPVELAFKYGMRVAALPSPDREIVLRIEKLREEACRRLLDQSPDWHDHPPDGAPLP
jgi:hypothetical protein